MPGCAILQVERGKEITKMLRTLYYVMIEGTEALVAICDDLKTAEWIRDNFPKKCIMRVTIGR